MQTPQAHAAPSYWAAAETAAAKADTSGGTDTSSCSGYYCTVETAAKLLGGASDIDSVTAYLARNFDAAQTLLQEEIA